LPRILANGILIILKGKPLFDGGTDAERMRPENMEVKMLRRIITEEIAVFMIGLIELVSIEFYESDRARAFKDLNDRKIWHHFIQKYEEKRGLPAETIVAQIEEMLGIEKTPGRKIHLPGDANTELIKKVILGVAKKYNWNYSVSIERVYASEVGGMLSDEKVDFSTLPLDEILELFDQHRMKNEAWL